MEYPVFTAIEWYRVTGRGWVVLVESDRERPRDNGCELVGNNVVVDGITYLCRGVERNLPAYPIRKGEKIGLLVTGDQEDTPYLFTRLEPMLVKMVRAIRREARGREALPVTESDLRSMRAALGAIRTPDEGMIAAAAGEYRHGSEFMIALREAIVEHHQAMIDHLINENPKV